MYPDNSADEYIQIEGLGAAVNKKNIEWVDWPIWDWVDLANGASSVNFFTTPYGGSKTQSDTNLATAGQVTEGLAYNIQSICFGVRLDQSTLIPYDEFRAIMWTGHLEFQINNRIYFKAPLSVLGWGGGIPFFSNITPAATEFGVNSGDFNRTAIYHLRKVVVLPKNVTFGVTAYWKSALTLSATEHVMCRFEGQLMRPRITNR